MMSSLQAGSGAILVTTSSNLDMAQANLASSDDTMSFSSLGARPLSRGPLLLVDGAVEGAALLDPKSLLFTIETIQLQAIVAP